MNKLREVRHGSRSFFDILQLECKKLFENAHAAKRQNLQDERLFGIEAVSEDVLDDCLNLDNTPREKRKQRLHMKNLTSYMD